MSSNNGRFTTDPGKFKKSRCGACGAQMKVKRNVFGPTQWGEAIGGGGHIHDTFNCPNLEEEWHEDVVALIEEVENTESRTIKSIIKKDILKILNRVRSKKKRRK